MKKYTFLCLLLTLGTGMAVAQQVLTDTLYMQVTAFWPGSAPCRGQKNFSVMTIGVSGKDTICILAPCVDSRFFIKGQRVMVTPPKDLRAAVVWPEGNKQKHYRTFLGRVFLVPDLSGKVYPKQGVLVSFKEAAAIAKKKGFYPTPDPQFADDLDLAAGLIYTRTGPQWIFPKVDTYLKEGSIQTTVLAIDSQTGEVSESTSVILPPPGIIPPQPAEGR